MATATVNQFDAILSILSNGKRITMDQLIERVHRKTKRSVTRNSLTVRLSQLRADGYDIVTLRGSASKAKDGSTQFQLVS